MLLLSKLQDGLLGIVEEMTTWGNLDAFRDTVNSAIFYTLKYANRYFVEKSKTNSSAKPLHKTKFAMLFRYDNDIVLRE